MKNIASLSVDISKYGDRVIENLIKAQRDTAKEVLKDAKLEAPGTGEYRETIQMTDTHYNGDTIVTKIYTDATVYTVTGGSYNLGELIEYGTRPHAIPNAWGKGETFGYVDNKGVYHKGTLDPDWHPGTAPNPHFKRALDKNIALYNFNIRKALKEAE